MRGEKDRNHGARAMNHCRKAVRALRLSGEDGLLGDRPSVGCSDQHSLSWEVPSPSSHVFSENCNIPMI